MKRVKRLFACLLALTMILGLSATAFAADGESTPTDQETVIIKKVYKLANAETTSPAEIFTLQQVGDGKVVDGEATEAPALGTITGASFAQGAATVAGATRNITVALPTYTNVGVYEYKLGESLGTTAGVDYYPEYIKLVVTVINGQNGNLRIAAVHTESEGDKKDSFENTYSAGTLDVSKTVTGNLGDKDKYFEFNVTLTGVTGKTYANSYAVTGSANTENPTTIAIGETTTFKLKHGDTIHIENLPYGVTYTVTETTADGYTTTKTGDTGTINAAKQTAAFTNDKNNGQIDTGVYLDNLPYILVFAGVLAIAAVFVVRRRRFED